MILFTADTHFGHDRIIQYANRPYDSAPSMDEDLIKRWNRRVTHEDTVYHLGDFTLGGPKEADYYFRQLNGRIFVLGSPWHHDRRWLNKRAYYSKSDEPVVILPPMYVLDIPKYGDEFYPKTIVLCHYPIAEWDRKHYGSWHLHGHSHGAYLYPVKELAIDVGVDVNELAPISLDEVAAIMDEKASERDL